MKRTFLLLMVTLGSITLSYAQWTKTNFTSYITSTIQCVTANGNNIFAGTISEGLFYSTNGGTTWSAATNGLTCKKVDCVDIDGNNIYAATNNGVFKSVNNGTSWSQTNFYAKSAYSVKKIGSYLFASDSISLWRSANNGSNWSKVLNHRVLSYVIKGSTIYAGTNPMGVYSSDDNGTTWTEVSNGLPYAEVLALVVAGNNIYAGFEGQGVYLSTNNGTSWTAVNNGLLTNYVNSLTTYGQNIFASITMVEYTPDNGQNWILANTGLTATSAVTYITIDGDYIWGGVLDAVTYYCSVWKCPLSSIPDLKNGIDDNINSDKNIVISPNPVSGLISIKLQNNKEQSFNVIVENLKGQTLINKIIDLKDIQTLDLSKLDNGIYILSLQNSKVNYKSKIVVQK